MKILTESQAERITNLAVPRLADYVTEYGIQCLVLGISGGIDSAVVGVLGLKTVKLLQQENYSLNIHYSFLDVHSDYQDLIKAQELARQFNFKLNKFNLTAWYEASPLLQLIPKNHTRTKVAQGNIKCRLRMIALYHFAQLNNGIYLDTDDLSEEYMGFWTKHGDEGDVKIIQHLTKDEVYDLGEHLGVPESILRSEPGDGLGVSVNNLASDQLGLPYMKIDYIISSFIRNGFNTEGDSYQLNSEKFANFLTGVSKQIDSSEDSVMKVIEQCLKTAYKRRYGDNVAHLLPHRVAMGLPDIGTREFNILYLDTIKKQ